MPRKKTKSIVAAHWAAEARRIVADQNELIMTLEASGRSALAAERALQTYLSALKHLEDHERRIGEEDKGKKGETKKDRRFRKRIPRSAG
jgi:hypothetical protein